jgi:hypothetical protein
MCPAKVFLGGSGGKPISSLATFNVKTQKSPDLHRGFSNYILSPPKGIYAKGIPLGGV